MSERFRYLFDRYFNKTETAAERDELMRFIDEPGSENLVMELMEEVYKKDHLDQDPFAAGTRERILTAALGEDLSLNNSDKVVSMKKPFRWIGYAAAIVVFAIAFGIYKYRVGKDRQNLAANKIQHDVKPGGNKAFLTLANGTRIELNSAQNGKLVQQGSTAVVKLANGSVAYIPGKSAAIESLSNTMATPRGGQYSLQLPDGTMVTLNAESSISYPTAFTGKTRNVTVTGEAYFEVAKNKKMPFIVSFGSQKVEVLGTHFDIRAYNGQPNKATLLEGSVKISNGAEKQLLIPGQQAVYNPDAQKFDLKMVDTDDIIAWKNGLFVFDDTDIEQVMLELSRWYNVSVVYSGAKPNLNFTGLIKRNITLSKALKILETTGGIKFTIADNKVTIEKR